MFKPPDDHLNVIAGDLDQLQGQTQKSEGVIRQEAEEQIKGSEESSNSKRH
jgi:hypothetical protein